jgi:hypothetical protein
MASAERRELSTPRRSNVVLLALGATRSQRQAQPQEAGAGLYPNSVIGSGIQTSSYSNVPLSNVLLLADLEDFIRDHWHPGPMTGDATEPAWNGYLLQVACPCRVTFERWVTAEEADRDLVVMALRNQTLYGDQLTRETAPAAPRTFRSGPA